MQEFHMTIKLPAEVSRMLTECQKALPVIIVLWVPLYYHS